MIEQGLYLKLLNPIIERTRIEQGLYLKLLTPIIERTRIEQGLLAIQIQCRHVAHVVSDGRSLI